MGIKNLSKFLKETCPHVYEEIHISEYAYKKVAIDISLYLFIYKTTMGDKWIYAFMKLIECLRKNEIHCVFIYDGGAPPEKQNERDSRTDSRDKIEERVCVLEDAMEHYHNTNEILPVLIEFQEKRKLHRKILLTEKFIFNASGVGYAIQKMRNGLVKLTKDDFKITKELFDILDVPYFTAPMEAETMCSDLCKRGEVDCVLSRDTDVLAYGAPIFITEIETRTGICKRVRYSQVLEELKLTSSQFLDFCIMCGTDYNKNIPKIGPKNSYKLILEYSTIEDIRDQKGLDISILNHIRTRELFTDYERSNISVNYCGSPQFDKLLEFMDSHNIRISVDELKQSFLHNNEIEFE